MTLETILLVFLSALAGAWAMSKKWYNIERARKEREKGLAESAERIKREAFEKSEDDLLSDIDKRYGPKQ